MKSFILAIALVLAGLPAWAGDCSNQIPYGAPKIASAGSTLACRLGYLAQVDRATLQPDWVAWRLTADRAIGCVPRKDAFHYDDQLPAGFHAVPGDYAKSGYNLGHMAPYQDNAKTPEMGRDSFDVPTNFSPQVPGLNRQGWEQLEVDSRAWAVQFGEVDIVDGPIFGPDPKRIGADGVAVPDADFKVIYAPAKHQAIAVIMPNSSVSKHDVPMYLVSVAEVERRTGIAIPLPADTDRTHVALMWPVDAVGFTRSKKAACAGH